MTPSGDAAVWLAGVLAERAGCAPPVLDPPAPGDAATRWGASGLAELTGPADRPPIAPGRDYVGRLEALVRVVKGFARALGADLALDMDVYGERARDMGLTRRGAISAGGAARMVRCRDSWLVANLARPEDLDLFEAWLGVPAGDDPWAALADAAEDRPAGEFAAGARLLGLAASVVAAACDEQRLARPAQSHGAPGFAHWRGGRPPRDPASLFVLDLSGLWAGPLCGRLFVELGARVVKVESMSRPDGARAGSLAFFERMNSRKQCISVDLASPPGRAALRELIEQADVVIEAARPRALAQLGVHADALARERPGRIWICLTAYGRTGPWSNAVGFGDDCAAAAGLVVRDGDGEPMFVGDAIADPIAGLMAAGAAFAGLAGGGFGLVDVALREAALFVAEAPVR
jgi:hypothetical protein